MNAMSQIEDLLPDSFACDCCGGGTARFVAVIETVRLPELAIMPRTRWDPADIDSTAEVDYRREVALFRCDSENECDAFVAPFLTDEPFYGGLEKIAADHSFAMLDPEDGVGEAFARQEWDGGPF